MKRVILCFFCLSLASPLLPAPSNAWYDETHVAMAKVNGYPKWFNAVGPDMIRLKIGIINDEVLDNLDKIKIYPIRIGSEEDLAKEIARIANLSIALGYKLEDENRILAKEEAYQQIGHSASLFKAILGFVKEANESGKLGISYCFFSIREELFPKISSWFLCPFIC